MHWSEVSCKQFFEHLEHWVTVVLLLVCQWCSCKPLTTDLNHQRLWLFGPRIFTSTIFIPRIFMPRLWTSQIFITRIFTLRSFRPDLYQEYLHHDYSHNLIFNFMQYLKKKQWLLPACVCVDWLLAWLNSKLVLESNCCVYWITPSAAGGFFVAPSPEYDPNVNNKDNSLSFLTAKPMYLSMNLVNHTIRSG